MIHHGGSRSEMALIFKVDVKIGDVESPVFPRAVVSDASLALRGRSANWFAVGSQAFSVKNVGYLEELLCRQTGR
jgi:hypothetical protein